MNKFDIDHIFEDLVLGAARAKFARAVPGNGADAINALSKPAKDDPAYASLGMIKSFKNETEYKTITTERCEDNGMYKQRDRKLPIKHKVKLTADDIPRLALDLSWGLKSNEDGTYKPFAAEQSIEGWWSADITDSLRGGAQIAHVEIYVIISLTNPPEGKSDPVTLEYELQVLDSDLNVFEYASE